jgi:excisionase family DNA binding protein
MSEIAHALWSVQDAAAYLKTTSGAIYKLVERRRIPHIRLGRRLLFDGKKLHDWIAGNQIPAEPAIRR